MSSVCLCVRASARVRAHGCVLMSSNALAASCMWFHSARRWPHAVKHHGASTKRQVLAQIQVLGVPDGDHARCVASSPRNERRGAPDTPSPYMAPNDPRPCSGLAEMRAWDAPPLSRARARARPPTHTPPNAARDQAELQWNEDYHLHQRTLASLLLTLVVKLIYIPLSAPGATSLRPHEAGSIAGVCFWLLGMPPRHSSHWRARSFHLAASCRAASQV